MTELTPYRPDAIDTTPRGHGVTSHYKLLEYWVKAQRSEKTKTLYARAGGNLIAFAEEKYREIYPEAEAPNLDEWMRGLNHAVASMTYPEWQEYESILARNHALSTAATYANACRSLFMFGQRLGYLMRSPAHIIKGKKRPDAKSTKELTEEEVLALVHAPRKARDRVLLELLYVSGIRAEEAATLFWKDVRRKGEHVVIQVIGKGEKVRSIQLPKGASRRLLALMTLDTKPEDAVFSAVGPPHPHPWTPMNPLSFNAIVLKARAAAGITKPVSPHWFRHAYAQHARAKGQTKDDIQDALGHASPQTTEGYLAAHEGLMLSADFITERD